MVRTMSLRQCEYIALDSQRGRPKSKAESSPITDKKTACRSPDGTA